MSDSIKGGGVAVTPPRRLFSRKKLRGEGRGAALLVAPYLLVLLVAGIVPTGYAVEQAFRSANGPGFTGFTNYSTVVNDFRFGSTFAHVGVLLLVWIPIMMIGVTAMALLVHASRGRFGTAMRFVYYLPGALAGIANFMLWLFILDPTVSPFEFLLHGFGYQTLNDVALPSHVPLILALMLFFQGAGTWLLILYGGFNGIPEEVIESASIDGAGAWRLTRDIKLPLIRPWLGYMLLLNIAYGFQLFLEPQVLGAATHGLLSPQYTPNQLSYTYAYQILNTPAAAAMSVIMLAITLAIGLVIVTRVGLFKETH